MKTLFAYLFDCSLAYCAGALTLLAAQERQAPLLVTIAIWGSLVVAIVAGVVWVAIAAWLGMATPAACPRCGRSDGVRLTRSSEGKSEGKFRVAAVCCNGKDTKTKWFEEPSGGAPSEA
jgi:hypothetical protein